LKKAAHDANSLFNFSNQIPLKRTAVLHSSDYFKPNNIAVINGLVRPLGQPKWTYGLSTKLNRGEFIPIRNIQCEDDSNFTEHKSRCLPNFLSEDGFPLQPSYADGDPLTTDRGGTIVIDQDKVIVIYPHYFIQRRLIDEQGNLVDIGLDENFSRKVLFEVKLVPSVSGYLVKRVSGKKYIPVVRYRSVPYASDYMLPLLDTPMSDSGWADLYIDTRGKAKLFIAKELPIFEWYVMMHRLKQLFYEELARKDYHILGITQDRGEFNQYLAKKQAILKDYYYIQEWQLL
jgi:hypothetical protein